MINKSSHIKYLLIINKEKMKNINFNQKILIYKMKDLNKN